MILIIMALLFSISARSQTEEIVIVETEFGTLEGTLTIASEEKAHPVVLLIAGSGPSDRDGNSPMLALNYLKLLSEGFVENGISTLRYDKRGSGKSMGTAIDTMTFEIFVNDAELFKNELVKDKRFSSVTVMGHSQGSLIGMLISKEGVDKYISSAGTGQAIQHILEDQLNAQSPFLGRAATPILEKLSEGETVDSIPSLLQSLFNYNNQPFLISWMKYDPAVIITELTIPTLILQGTTDIQVSMEEARMLIEACSCDSLIIDGMNHLLKRADADREKNLATYYDPELPLHEDLMEGIIKFIRREE